ncbi:MAG: beta-ketoacyl-ACP synthase II [Gammaproteobacteria bacterium]
MNRRCVVVTGMGLLTPVGNTVGQSWRNIVEGRSGIVPITAFDASAFCTRFSGPIKGFRLEEYVSPKDARKMDPFIHYGMAAGMQAFDDCGLEVTEENAPRIGVAIGSGIGGLWGIEHGTETWLTSGPRRLSPFYISSNIINMLGGNLSIRYGLKGPNYAIVTACASGTHCIGNAARVIEYGDADVMVAGGAEMATTPTALGGFCSARALSTRNDDPQGASRPFDKDRDGFVLSDGAGVIVLEEYEHAKRRGAKIYAELVGSGMSGDGYHMTAPAPGGEGAANCMRAALDNARISAAEIDYINAHGTSTPAGDLAETLAIKSVCGGGAYKIAVSSTKSMTGHALGAAGGIEAVFTILSIRDRVAPPTINYTTPDPECDLDYVPNEARDLNIEYALSNSFGFGGANGTLVFRRI